MNRLQSYKKVVPSPLRRERLYFVIALLWKIIKKSQEKYLLVLGRQS